MAMLDDSAKFFQWRVGTGCDLDDGFVRRTYSKDDGRMVIVSFRPTSGVADLLVIQGDGKRRWPQVDRVREAMAELCVDDAGMLL
jgi:hypothetical protein